MTGSQKNLKASPRVVQAPTSVVPTGVVPTSVVPTNVVPTKAVKSNQPEAISAAQSAPPIKPSTSPTATPSKPAPTLKDLPPPPPLTPEIKRARQHAKARTFAQQVLSEIPKTQLKMRRLSLTLKTAQKAISAKMKPSRESLRQLRSRLDLASTEADALTLTTAPTGSMVKQLNIALAETIGRKEVKLKERLEESIKVVQKLNPVILMLKKRIISAREALKEG